MILQEKYCNTAIEDQLTFKESEAETALHALVRHAHEHQPIDGNIVKHKFVIDIGHAGLIRGDLLQDGTGHLEEVAASLK